jgi:hypothetical protein
MSSYGAQYAAESGHTGPFHSHHTHTPSALTQLHGTPAASAPSSASYLEQNLLHNNASDLYKRLTPSSSPALLTNSIGHGDTPTNYSTHPTPTPPLHSANNQPVAAHPLPRHLSRAMVDAGHEGSYGQQHSREVSYALQHSQEVNYAQHHSQKVGYGQQQHSQQMGHPQQHSQKVVGYGEQHSQQMNYAQLKKHKSQQSLHSFAKQKKLKKRLPKLDAAIAEVQEAKARIVDMDYRLVSRDQQNELVDLIMKNVHVWKVNLKRR